MRLCAHFFWSCNTTHVLDEVIWYFPYIYMYIWSESNECTIGPASAALSVGVIYHADDHLGNTHIHTHRAQTAHTHTHKYTHKQKTHKQDGRSTALHLSGSVSINWDVTIILDRRRPPLCYQAWRSNLVPFWVLSWLQGVQHSSAHGSWTYPRNTPSRSAGCRQ
jgi:hypothetical protein